MARRTVLVFPAGLLLLLACATRPVVYPNEKLRRSGGAQVEEDTESCLAAAREYVKTGRTREVAQSTAEGAAVGGAIGAASGAVLGEGRGAGAGAAGGAAGGFMRSILRSRDPDPIEKAYVNRCLAERGYDVLGWR